MSEVLPSHFPAASQSPTRRSSLSSAPLSIEVPQRQPSYIRETAHATGSPPEPVEAATPNMGELSDHQHDSSPKPARRRSQTIADPEQRRQSTTQQALVKNETTEKT